MQPLQLTEQKLISLPQEKPVTPSLLPLSDKEMPASLAGQALRWMAKTDTLNPPNKGQDRFSRYIGKPIRFVARLIYGLVVPILAGLVGIIYHSTSATICAIKSKSTREPMLKAYFEELTKGHCKALKKDLEAISFTLMLNLCGIGPILLGPMLFGPSEGVAAWCMSFFNKMLVRENLTDPDEYATHASYVYKELLARS